MVLCVVFVRLRKGGELCSDLDLRARVADTSFPMCLVGVHFYLIVDTNLLLEVNRVIPRPRK